MTSVTRVYRFSASHRLHSAQLSDSENAEIFGKCNNPYGHGHDYVLSVTVSGKINNRTGVLVPLALLDQLVDQHVLGLFAHKNVNVDVPQFADVIPTTENIVLVIAGLMEEHWAAYFDRGGPRLHRVHVQETDRNGFEVLLPLAYPAKRLTDSEGSL